MNIPQELRNEELLLTGLCRMEFTEAQSEEINALAHKVSDWSYFVSLANAHGVVAMVCHNLERLKLFKYLPGNVAVTLRNSLMKSLSRNEFNLKITNEALNLLNREQIKVVLLKGMALEMTVYGNQGLRQMSDVDVLVEKNQCEKARNILMANGFRSLPVKSVLHNFIIKNLGKHLPSLEKNGGLFEIHHELFGGVKNGLTRLLLERSSETVLKTEKAFIPDPQLLFLYLVRHLWLHEKNNESQLRLYTDLVVLLEKHRDDIINIGLTGYAARAGIKEVLATRLKILQDHWKIAFPPYIDDFINQWYEPDFINKFFFFLKSPKGNPPIGKGWSYRHAVSEIPGFHRKIVYVAGDLFPTVRFMEKRYKCRGWRAYLFYPHRFGKLVFLFKK